MKVAEEQARKKARKLARTLGDQEWKNGRINNAMEAYEASDITSHELYENADRLMKAIELLPKTKDPLCFK